MFQSLGSSPFEATANGCYGFKLCYGNRGKWSLDSTLLVQIRILVKVWVRVLETIGSRYCIVIS